ncbi:uncharacterized protein LOC135429177 isoform X2 [Drosophila montana]|uniref:uncharacterized protein LOC135429177 isoform X2 n=1 Tax=Drosophila montana TaxID=40370 RepID=UPI00313B7A5F
MLATCLLASARVGRHGPFPHQWIISRTLFSFTEQHKERTSPPTAVGNNMADAITFRAFPSLSEINEVSLKGFSNLLCFCLRLLLGARLGVIERTHSYDVGVVSPVGASSPGRLSLSATLGVVVVHSGSDPSRVDKIGGPQLTSL